MTSTTDFHNESTTSTDDSFIQGIKDCVPTLLGYISIGLAFGVVGSASGLSVVEIALLTILVLRRFCTIYFLRTFANK